MKAPYSSFEHLVLSVCSDRGKGWRFVMLDAQTVYVDDSGTDGNSHIAAAAFCVSTVDRWLEFEQSWRKIADHAGFELKQWHMTEFAACRRDHLCRQCEHGDTSAADHPWQKWSVAKRKNVLNRLAKSLVKHVEYGLGLAFAKADYDKYVKTSPARALANEPVGDEHFTFAIQNCGGQFAEWRKATGRQDQLVKFVFDTASTRQKREIAKVFFAAANERTKYQGGIERWFEDRGTAFEDRRDTPQLLSADMMAWTIATLRARHLQPRKGRHEEVIQLAGVFTRPDAEHINIGYTQEQAFIDWEKRVLDEAKGQSGVSELRPDDARTDKRSA